MSRNPATQDAVIADVVAEAVKQTRPWTEGSPKRFISDVYDTVVAQGRDAGMSLAEFKDTLWRLHREGLVVLARADLVAAMPPGKVRRSELSKAGADFHFVVGATANVSKSDADFAKFLAKTKRRHEHREAEVRAALKVSQALILTRGEFAELVVVSGETYPGQAPLRVTTFLVDGPWGHENYKTNDEIAIELGRRTWDTIRAADDHEVIDWTSTPEFIEGSRRVAYIQAANALRYQASQATSPAERERISEIVRRADRMDPSDIEKAIALLERELAAAHARPTSNPPWTTKVLADAYEDMEKLVPPAWLPKLSDVGSQRDTMTAKLREYGCGAYGCVMPTLDPDIVLKITTDETEAEFADQLSHTLVAPICVEYHTVQKLAVKHQRRPVYLLWRESAESVGDLEAELGPTAGDYVTIQHAAAQDVIKLIMAGAPSTRISAAISVWLDTCHQMADQDGVPALQPLGRGMVAVFMQQRIFFGDVHAGNLGRVRRIGAPNWVITDPGNVVVFGKASS